MEPPRKKVKTDEGPLPMTVHVLEELMLRQYASGGQYGTTFCTTPLDDFRKITPLIVNERNLGTMKGDKSFVLLKYLVLQDGTIKIGQQTVVMHTKRPTALDEDIVRDFRYPPLLTELGRVASLDNKKRISVKGEVEKVSNVIQTNLSRRKIVTLTDGNASIEVKLWGNKADASIVEGSSISISCVHVDEYQGKKSLNSSGSTVVENVDTEEEFSGTIEGVSFDESNLSILIDGELLSCSLDHLREIFPEQEFQENMRVKGRRRQSLVTSIETENTDDELAEVEDELLGVRSLLK